MFRKKSDHSKVTRNASREENGERSAYACRLLHGKFMMGPLTKMLHGDKREYVAS